MVNYAQKFITNVGKRTLVISLILILTGLGLILYTEISKNSIETIPSEDFSTYNEKNAYSNDLNLDDEHANSNVQDINDLNQLVSQFSNPKDLNIPSKDFDIPINIEIPAINLNSEIMQLKIVDIGESSQYETPNNVVGHIPSSSNPGEPGSIWLFGHLESPIRNEGSIFSRLPEIHDLIKNGNSIHIILKTNNAKFLYEVNDFSVIPEEKLIINDSEKSSLFLVTCWPKFVYDERIIVGSVLVGVQLEEN